MPTTPGPSASAKILITEKTPLMIPKERPETGGKEGLINVRDLYSLSTSDPAPFPVAIPPHLLSLRTTSPWKSGMEEKQQPLRARGCFWLPW